jgi:aminodeoxyfutalosine deaminase
MAKAIKRVIFLASRQLGGLEEREESEIIARDPFITNKEFQASLVDSLTLTARWIVPIANPPLPEGTITIAGGRIQRVKPRGPYRADLDLGNVAILPGFVNAHTHLDLSGARDQVRPTGDFTHWLRNVIRFRTTRSTDQIREDIKSGIAECLVHGTTLLGDIASQGLSWNLLAQAPVRSTVFFELLGLPLERVEQAKREAIAWLDRHSATSNCRPGLSPHAPYSVRSSLFEWAFQEAKRRQIHVATHWAETREELELLEHQQGPFVDFLAELGVWDPEGLVRSPDDIIRQSSLLPNLLIIHGNYLSAEFLQAMSLHSPPTTHHSPTVIYCPRTHASFGHDPHPFQQILASSGRVALGTDSLASNPDLDVLAEARYLHRQYPTIPGLTLLRMITLSGAESLGWENETGSLAPGKSADLAVLPLPSEDADEPYRLILESSTSVERVMFRGNWIRNPSVDKT